MKASRIVTEAVKSLKVSPQTVAEATEMLGDADITEKDAFLKFYREWVNDVLILLGRPQFNIARCEPDKSFLLWLDRRLNDPFHVTLRAHDAVRAEFGDELALLFSEIRWTQEIAWAKRMRGSDNDRIVMLAELCLKAARRDPAKMFRELVWVYVNEAAMDIAYKESPFHMLEERDILNGTVEDDHWRPLWLRFAEKAFGKSISAMSRAQMTAVTEKIRESEWKERTARIRYGQADKLRSQRPCLMNAVLTMAIEQGLSSDDVVFAEKEFIALVEKGEIDLSNSPQPAWRLFMNQLSGWAETAPSPAEDERRLRLATVRNLSPAWSDTLPENFLVLGGDDQVNVIEWYEAIVETGERMPPLDPVVDYGMYLLEEIVGAGFRQAS